LYEPAKVVTKLAASLYARTEWPSARYTTLAPAPAVSLTATPPDSEKKVAHSSEFALDELQTLPSRQKGEFSPAVRASTPVSRFRSRRKKLSASTTKSVSPAEKATPLGLSNVFIP
jgi:hypothetical protein